MGTERSLSEELDDLTALLATAPDFEESTSIGQSNKLPQPPIVCPPARELGRPPRRPHNRPQAKKRLAGQQIPPGSAHNPVYSLSQRGQIAAVRGTKGYKEVTPKQAFEAIVANKYTKQNAGDWVEQGFIVDCRSQSEILGHEVKGRKGVICRGAVPWAMEVMRVESFPDVFHEDELWMEREIFLIDTDGGKSTLALMALNNVGFKDVKVIAGGLHAWVDASLPVVFIGGGDISSDSDSSAD